MNTEDPIRKIREENLKLAQELLHNATGEYRKWLTKEINELTSLLNKGA